MLCLSKSKWLCIIVTICLCLSVIKCANLSWWSPLVILGHLSVSDSPVCFNEFYPLSAENKAQDHNTGLQSEFYDLGPSLCHIYYMNPKSRSGSALALADLGLLCLVFNKCPETSLWTMNGLGKTDRNVSPLITLT